MTSTGVPSILILRGAERKSKPLHLSEGTAEAWQRGLEPADTWRLLDPATVLSFLNYLKPQILSTWTF